jgi:uncharacterized protein YciI
MKLKITCFILLLIVATTSCFAQADKKNPNEKNQSQLKLPGDKAFELKQYFLVMLVKGDNRTQDSVSAEKLQEGHMANMRRLAEMGKLIVAGPFGDDGNWRGIFIFDCKTKEEVEELVKTDPAISSGRMNYEIHPWWTAKNCVFK